MPNLRKEAPALQGRKAMQYLDWRALAISKAAPPSVYLGTSSPVAEVKMLEGASGRILRYIISSEKPDRYRDIVHQDGMDSSDYHGVVLWGHHYGGWEEPPLPPIGRTLKLSQEIRGGFKCTIAEAEFAGKDQGYELAETIYQMGKIGMCPDCSIGFDPLEWTFDEVRGGVNFLKWALLEWSVVPIGACTDAVQINAAAKDAGIDIAPLREWAIRCLDDFDGEPQIVVPKAKLESIAWELGVKKSTFVLGGPSLVDQIQSSIAAGRKALAAKNGDATEALEIIPEAVVVEPDVVIEPVVEADPVPEVELAAEPAPEAEAAGGDAEPVKLHISMLADFKARLDALEKQLAPAADPEPVPEAAVAPTRDDVLRDAANILRMPPKPKSLIPTVAEVKAAITPLVQNAVQDRIRRHTGRLD